MLKLEAMPAQMPKNPRIGHGLFLLGILVDLDQGVIGLTTSASHACMHPLTALAQASQAMRPATSAGRRSHTGTPHLGLHGFIREHHKACREIPYCRMVHENVERAKLDLIVVPAGMQRVEVLDAVNAQDDRLTVDDEPLLPVLQRRLHDPRIALGPVVPTRVINRTRSPSRSTL